jgi:hypothetical protein
MDLVKRSKNRKDNGSDNGDKEAVEEDNDRADNIEKTDDKILTKRERIEKLIAQRLKNSEKIKKDDLAIKPKNKKNNNVEDEEDNLSDLQVFDEEDEGEGEEFEEDEEGEEGEEDDLGEEQEDDEGEEESEQD